MSEVESRCRPREYFFRSLTSILSYAAGSRRGDLIVIGAYSRGPASVEVGVRRAQRERC